ncbi:6-phosphofructokinase [Caldisericum exile]|uniref:ATP-dependent 6-phosphofructokinase n=1 Tax=Caldisericum exile (strain DSM 21853 / NBRC 104410 / AZM16c01) TaxID=511051 RepID=A0A7U6GEJ4_CALEA|nr:6-phosphofructokinase [Caldisericum exile]BAL80926.1 6-phosphofructokinase [Caldisericum exile AZM16c01]
MKRIAVLTSGGDAPGMNAAIRSVARIGFSRGVEVIGVYEGYKGLIKKEFKKLLPRDVSGLLEEGGTFLLSSRAEEFKDDSIQEITIKNMKEEGIEGLVVIGGNGSQSGSLSLFNKGFPVVGVASTIDNDLWGTDYTIGFDTAVNTAIEAIDKIRDTATSHSRTFIVEVMGRNRGFIALEAGLASGADIVLVPERRFDIEKIVENIQRGLEKKKKHHMIVTAEGAIRAQDLQTRIKEKLPELDVKYSVLGYIQRGGAPTRFDRIIATMFGAEAVDLLIQGNPGFVVGIKDNRIVHIPFEDAVKKFKEINYKLYDIIEEVSV